MKTNKTHPTPEQHRHPRLAIVGANGTILHVQKIFQWLGEVRIPIPPGAPIFIYRRLPEKSDGRAHVEAAYHINSKVKLGWVFRDELTTDPNAPTEPPESPVLDEPDE